MRRSDVVDIEIATTTRLLSVKGRMKEKVGSSRYLGIFAICPTKKSWV